MAKSSDKFEIFYAKNRQEWHQWLVENHDTTSGIRLIYYKKNSDKPRVEYNDAVEEAISFGWIDSKANILDDERYMQVFTPRKPHSNWSKTIKFVLENLIKNGLMQSAGMEKVMLPKKTVHGLF